MFPSPPLGLKPRANQQYDLLDARMSLCRRCTDISAWQSRVLSVCPLCHLNQIPLRGPRDSLGENHFECVPSGSSVALRMRPKAVRHTSLVYTPKPITLHWYPWRAVGLWLSVASCDATRLVRDSTHRVILHMFTRLEHGPTLQWIHAVILIFLSSTGHRSSGALLPRYLDAHAMPTRDSGATAGGISTQFSLYGSLTGVGYSAMGIYKGCWTLTPHELQEFIEDTAGIRLYRTGHFAALTLLFFDLLLTASEEWRYLWMRKKTLIFYLFILLRYATLASVVSGSILDGYSGPLSMKGCYAEMYLSGALTLTVSFAVNALFMLRTFAIWNRSALVLLILCLITLTYIIINSVMGFSSLYLDVFAEDSLGGFLDNCASLPKQGYRAWSLLVTTLPLAFDTTVFVLTVARTLTSCRERRGLGLRQGYSYFILRDGVIYYCAVEATGIIYTLLMQLPNQNANSFVIQPILNSLSSILCQRLILSLRSVEDSNLGTQRSIQLDGIEFASGPFLGNIGAPLRDLGDGEEGENAIDRENDTLDAEPTQLSEGIASCRPVSDVALADLASNGINFERILSREALGPSPALHPGRPISSGGGNTNIEEVTL